MLPSVFDQFHVRPSQIGETQIGSHQFANFHSSLYSECDLEIRFTKNHPRFQSRVFLQHPIVFRADRQTDAGSIANVVKRQKSYPVAISCTVDQAASIPIDVNLTRFVTVNFDAIPEKTDIETADVVCIEFFASHQQSGLDFLRTPSMPLDVSTIDHLISKVTALRSICVSSPIGISVVAGSCDPQLITNIAPHIDFAIVVAASSNETRTSDLHLSGLQSVASAIAASEQETLLLADLPLRSAEEIFKCLALGARAVLDSSVFDASQDSVDDQHDNPTIASLPKLLPTPNESDDESFLQTLLSDLQLHLKTTGVARLSELGVDHLIRPVN